MGDFEQHIYMLTNDSQTLLILLGHSRVTVLAESVLEGFNEGSLEYTDSKHCGLRRALPHYLRD